MKFISIGSACNVKHQINKHIGGCESLFFDWLMVDMNSVITVLEHYNKIDDLLFFDNIIKDPKKPYKDGNVRLLIKSLSHCISIHDVEKSYTDYDINNFIEKYKRRLVRIFNYINSDDRICFVKYGNVTSEEKERFIQTIKDINVDCDFFLIAIKPNQESDDIKVEDNYLEINLEKQDKPYPNDWTTSYLNWKKIFSDIKCNI